MSSEQNKFSILIVCTGNTCRSPMAEGALRHLLEKERPGKSDVSSAGMAAAEGYPATKYAVEAVRMWDVDISGHQSRFLTEELVENSDLILCMAPEHHHAVLNLKSDAAEKTYLLKSFPDNSPVGEDVEDPIGQPLDTYNETFLEIGEYLGKYLTDIVARIDAGQNA